MSTLGGRRAFIAGGSRGIGLAIAQRFAAEGVACTLAARSPARLAEAVGSLARTAAAHSAVAGDVRSYAFWKEAVAKQQYDILVNAAGVSQTSLLAATPESDVVEILETNLQGTIWGCKAFLRQALKHRKEGCIINISSVLARTGGSGAAVYAASKAGVIALTRALALEGDGRGIRANVILPGLVSTDMTRDTFQTSQKQKHGIFKSIPAGRWGEAAEVADAAIFLARNPYANNCVLNLDGGLSAH